MDHEPPTLNYIHREFPIMHEPPSLMTFVVVSLLMIVAGFFLADAGNIGKGQYDLRALIGIGCVFGGMGAYFLGRHLRRRKNAG